MFAAASTQGQIIVGIIVILASAIVLAVGAWAWRHVREDLGLIRAQITPNGGDTDQLGDVSLRALLAAERNGQVLLEHTRSDQSNFEFIIKQVAEVSSDASAASEAAAAAAQEAADAAGLVQEFIERIETKKKKL